MSDIPILETERLILRPQTMDDWPAYRALMLSDRAVYMGGPHHEQIAWGMFCHDHAQWDLFGFGALMIDRRSDGLCVGQVGINSGPLFPEQELGWLLYEGFEGSGYAFEAAKELRRWAFEDRKLTRLVSYMHPDNIRSRLLAEKLGAVLDEKATREDPDDLVFRHHRDPR